MNYASVYEIRAAAINREISELQRLLAFQRDKLASVQETCPHVETRPSLMQTMGEPQLECKHCGKIL